MHLTQIFFLANLAATRRAVQFGHFPIEEREARAIRLTQVFGSSQAILHGYDVVPCPPRRRPNLGHRLKASYAPG